MKNIVFKLGYMETPFFCTDKASVGCVEIDELPISESNKSTLKNLDRIYQSLLNHDNPSKSGFSSAEANKLLGAAINKESKEIYDKIITELNKDYNITYKPIQKDNESLFYF